MPSEKQNSNWHNEDISEILGFMPRWIFRWGTSVIFLLIMVAFVLSYYITYPDTLNAEITLTTLNPPVNLIAKSNGKILFLSVKNNDRVKAGQVIAVTENASDYNDVYYLYTYCNGYIVRLKTSDTLPAFQLREDLIVGDLTPAYLLALKSVKDFNLYQEINANNQQIALLKKDLENYNDLLGKYKKQLAINAEELALYEKDYRRDAQLYSDGVIPARESEAKKKELLKALNAHEQIKIMVSNALIQINTIEKSILQLRIVTFEEKVRLKNELQKNLQTLISEIIKWRQIYVIESPVNGKISFFNFWAVNQNIKSGDELFYVVPDQEQKFIGKCTLPANNSGKLAIGQKVNIKLNNYPYNENGMLQGVVSNISEVPNKDNYSIDVTLNRGLITSYNKTLIYKEEMKGSADIITKNLTVMERIFFNFKKLLDR